MSTSVTITLIDTCTGGSHYHLDAVVDAGPTRHFGVDLETVNLWRNGLTEDEMLTALGVIMKMYSKGKTLLQVRNGLLAGVVVTIG